MRERPTASDGAARAGSRVTYVFDTQADREADWRVASVRLAESVSTPYEAVVELVTLSGDDPALLLGRACTLTVRRDDAQRSVQGIVHRVTHAEPGAGGASARVTIAPALSVLALRTDCRIFQDKTVPEVLDLVLRPALAAYDRRFVSKLRRATYPKREYIVQHRESDLAFVERLMAEEGIWYCFEHPRGTGRDDGEVLLLLDQNDDAPVAAFGADGAELPIDRSQAPMAHRESIGAFVREHELGSTSVLVAAYDWTQPSMPIQRAEPEAAGERPRYEPHGATLWDYRDARYAASDAGEQARMRLDAQLGRAPRARGTGNVVGLCVGQRVEVDGSPWVVTSNHVRGRDAARIDRDARQVEDYACDFTAAGCDVPLRPPRKPKPRVYGVQTGFVVGVDGRPEVALGGDDIHTDEHGRVRVRLVWDRTTAGEPDATTTCFLRVAQGWAGSGAGFFFLPRVGMEVVVSFVDGDPDRPLVTGCLYNGLSRAMYEQPAHKTRSYIRTQSSPSGKGANELQFEDADGHEQILLHAQRDHREVVGRNQHIRVRADRRVDVGGASTTRVVGDDAHDVGGQRTTMVHGTDALAITGDRLVDVGGGEVTRIDKARRLEVGQRDTEVFSGGREITVERGERVRVLGGAHKQDYVTGQYNIVADAHFKVAQGASELYMKDAFYVSTCGDVQLKNTGFHLHARTDGHTAISVDKQLTIKVGRSRITMDADGSVEIVGPLRALVRAEGGALSATAQDVKVSGTQVAISGTSVTEITAPLVKIN